MTEITALLVKGLRDRTGVGIMECKRALAEVDGDIELAIEHLRKNSGLKAASKAGRLAAEGLLGIKIADGGAAAVLVEVNIETDFAARNQAFIDFVEVVTERAYQQQTDKIETLLNNGLEKERQTLVQEIGEHVDIRRITFMSAAHDGRIAGYLHGNRRIGALVHISTDDLELGKDIAMHIVAANPQAIKATDLSEEIIAKEREIYTIDAKRSGKPDAIIEKMINGRVRKFLNEVTLLEQPFVKDLDKKIGYLLKTAGAEVLAFKRFEVSEGIEREASDFAREVAKASQSTQ